MDKLRKVLTAEPQKAALWGALADAYVGAAHQHTSDETPALYQKAYEAFGKVAELEPDNAGNYNNYALALAAGGKVDEAKQQLAKAIGLDSPSGLLGY